MKRHGKIHKKQRARVSSNIHRQQHGQGTNTGRSQDILLDGGRETAKEGSEKRMSVKWRPQFIQ